MFKFVFRNEIGHIFRNKNFNYAKKQLDTLSLQYNAKLPMQRSDNSWRVQLDPVPELDFLCARKLLGMFTKKVDYTLRIENRQLSIFTNDQKFLHDCIKKVPEKSRSELWEPDNEYISFLKNNSNTIISSTPVDYKYKVTLKTTPDINFITWALDNPDKIKIGQRTANSIRNQWYINGAYFFAKTSKILTLCHLQCGHNIRRIDKIVHKNNIDK